MSQKREKLNSEEPSSLFSLPKPYKDLSFCVNCSHFVHLPGFGRYEGVLKNVFYNSVNNVDLVYVFFLFPKTYILRFNDEQIIFFPCFHVFMSIGRIGW